jgi:uncharacterized protein YciI
VDFDRFTVVLLVARPDAPELDPDAADALQDAHLDFLAQLHESGHALAAGPLLGAPDREQRGLTILRLEPERAREVCEQDPAVRAGRFSIRILPWMVPRGALTYSPTRFPHSSAEAAGG